jgi:hypothetical protein
VDASIVPPRFDESSRIGNRHILVFGFMHEHPPR